MNWLDGLVIVAVGVGLFWGVRQGFWRQVWSGIGVVFGLTAGAFLYQHLAFLTEQSVVRTGILSLLLLGAVFLGYDLARRLGDRLYRRYKRFVPRDVLLNRMLGALAGAASAIVVVWLQGVMFSNASLGNIGAAIKHSAILQASYTVVRPPLLFQNVSHLLDPFGAPVAFVGTEPTFQTSSSTISHEFEKLDSAIAQAEPAVMRVNVWGCGSTTNGSGFLVDPGLIVTNAHVIAGADRMSVIENGNVHMARAIFFDPYLDMAVLATDTALSITPLKISGSALAPGTLGAVLGYPAGGDLQTGDATVIDVLTAEGYDIYGQSQTTRRMYVVRGSVVPGDSGGPLINGSGEVAGLIFGKATTSDKTGYALTADQLLGAIQSIPQQRPSVGTGTCRG